MRSLASVVPVFIFVYLKGSAVLAFTQCYYPDGSIPTDYVWVPCTGATYSSCCVPSEGDVCQPDGLCYFPDEDMLYRGACTDRTWNDPSCNADICVTGFETTWSWALQCAGSDSYLCGELDSFNSHETPTCPTNAAAQTAGFVTTASTTKASRYTPPPSVNTAEFSVFTSSYTAIITANAQTTTLTSTFASTFTRKIGEAAATITSSPTTGITVGISSDSPSSDKGAVTISIGALVGIILGAILLLSLALLAVIIIHRRRTQKKEEAIRLNSATDCPPPNGPVGRDQVYPYEVPENEVSALPTKYTYVAPKVDTYEIDDLNAVMRREKVGMGMEERREEELRSPAPTYSEALMPVELDATPSLRGTDRAYGRY